MDKKLNTGTLFLIPALLGESQAGNVLPEGTLEVIRKLDHFIVEEIRTARRFLRSVGVTKSFDEEICFYVYNEHTSATDPAVFLEPLLNGSDTGLLSEAGSPCVADPGSPVILAAHLHGIRVVPLTGPSSLLLALMASGFNGQQFAFHGYLPVELPDLARKIREMERNISEKDQTQVFIETPYRNLRLFEALVKTCQPSTLLCIAAGLTTPREWIRTRSIGEWKKAAPDIHKVPAVFLLYH